MKVQLYGRRHSRDLREQIHQQLMEIAADQKNQRVNEVAMSNVITQLMNHIDDLEYFICENSNLDNWDTREVEEGEAFFDKDMFQLS